jgi:hypothetical protein
MSAPINPHYASHETWKVSWPSCNNSLPLFTTSLPLPVNEEANLLKAAPNQEFLGQRCAQHLGGSWRDGLHPPGNWV